MEEVKEFKDLGITTDHHLNWNSHTDKVVARANKMLGLIKRTCRSLDDPKTLKTLFCSLVRSNLEYCSVVWSPYTKRNIKKIVGVQRRATKFILKTEDDYDTRLRLILCGIDEKVTLCRISTTQTCQMWPLVIFMIVLIQNCKVIHKLRIKNCLPKNPHSRNLKNWSRLITQHRQEKMKANFGNPSQVIFRH